LCVILALSVGLAPSPAHAADAPPSGLWDAGIVVNGVLIPFRLELTISGDRASGAFFNGDERVRSSSGNFRAESLVLAFAQYATSLQARWHDGSLTGAYARNGQGYAFQARPHTVAAAVSGKVPAIAGQWEIALENRKGEAAWRLFIRQSGAEVTASILRVDGDTGALSGSYRDGKFVLSHFSGARPLLLEITANADGSLSLVQNGSTQYTALKSSQARAKNLPLPADPSRWTSVKDPTEPLRFSAPDLSGRTVTESDPRFKGKVVLVNIMGSWCPNCHDEAPFLEELYRSYKKRGLEVVALSFEDSAQLADPTRLRAFIATYGIDYTVLLAGEPSELREKLPQALNLTTWPATFFVARSGLVSGTHAGFAGKATGAAHEQLKAELRATVERLLAQKP
ncbi:MAG TPA: TlpA disulfide reductase family protein, partial [Polyangiaceae bacterium]|nr:TlpA disulfide reductase family protein [Polyangiaceae bacterium]